MGNAYDYDPYVGPTYGSPNLSQYTPQSAPMQTANNSSFWDDWQKSVMSGSVGGGTGGVGSTVGSIGGSLLGSMAGPVGGVIGGKLGQVGGELIEGAIMGDEGGEGDKLAREQKQSEQETRAWQERNAAPTAGLGMYMQRQLALEGMPVLQFINWWDFMQNKLLPYMRTSGLIKSKAGKRRYAYE